MKHSKKLFLFSLVCLGLVVVLYIAVSSMNAYRELRKIHTGSLWHLPSRVYSSGFTLAPGTDITRSALMERLSRLGYRSTTAVTAPGGYCLLKDSIIIYLHAFDYSDGLHDAKKVRLLLDRGRILAVLDEEGRRRIPSALLEPECIATIYDAGFEDREIVSLKACPSELIQAILCVEDKRFYAHRGIDVRSMARAIVTDVFHGSVLEGGSTITQQLVKNLFLTHERTLTRKFKEMWLSLIMERVFTKDEILFMYINEIYLGRFGPAGIHGFARASRLFFDKDVSQLDLNEAALLAGLVRAPNIYSPYHHPKAALDRRNTILGLMQEQGTITPTQYEKAVHNPLGVVPFSTATRQAPYFIDHVMNSIHGLFPEDDLPSGGGLHIFTTLDMHMQHVTEDIVIKGMAAFPGNIQAACVIVNPSNGRIMAMVGGRDYSRSQFNRATLIRRNIGSLVKPVIYYCALKRGYTLSSVLEDRPVSVTLANRTAWSPANFDSVSHGNVLLKDSLINSYNQATVRLGLALGLGWIVPEVRKVLPEAAVTENPSILLGAVDSSPLDVAAMYSVFASGGLKYDPWCLKAVTDNHGAVLWKTGRKDPERILDPGPAYLLNTALQEVIRGGTAKSARSYGVPDGICGKTGTTDDMRDSWFAAYTQDMAIVVWMGDDAYRATGLTGATGALPICARILARLAAPRPFEVPDGIAFCDVDPTNGRRATRWTAAPVRLPYLKGTEPAEVSEEGIPGIWKVLRSIFPFRR